MPMYSFACTWCKHTDSEFMQMANSVPIGEVIICPKCGHTNYQRQVDLAHTDLKEFHEPITMFSVGCNSWEEIREIQKKCPDVQISTDENDELFGVPVVKNRHEKMQVLAATGFMEKN